jgi:hypothetical protein
MNKALNVFEHDERIWGVSGYTPPVKIPSDYKDDIYLSLRPSSWGLGTWENRWNAVDWAKAGIEAVFHNAQAKKIFCAAGEDILNTLIKYPKAYDLAIYYHMRKQHKYSVFPVVSLLKNIGTDGTGVHFTSKQKKYEVTLLQSKEFAINPNVQPDSKMFKLIKKFYTKKWYRKSMIFVTKKFGVYNFLQKRFG